MRVIIVLALIGAACAVQRHSNRIVGGEETTIENYPFMANMLLYIVSEFMQYCGGTLISSTAVVSAAHCFQYDLSSSSWRVGLGSTLTTPGENVHTIKEIISHPDYNKKTLEHDVAVFKLTNPAVISDRINISRIAGPNYILPDNTLVYIVGWGVINTDGDDSDVLRHAAVQIINQQICIDRYAFLKKLPWLNSMPDVTPEMLCTGILNVGGKDACQGDSGGPVIHNKDVIVGITSWGHRCGSRFYPGVNMRVSSYSDWIYNNALNE